MAVAASVLLAVACGSATAPVQPQYFISHGFMADTGGFCRLHFQVTTNARGGAQFTVLLDSLGTYPPQFMVTFHQDTAVDITPARLPPYRAFWNLYFPVPGTAVVVSATDSAQILAAPSC